MVQKWCKKGAPTLQFYQHSPHVVVRRWRRKSWIIHNFCPRTFDDLTCSGGILESPALSAMPWADVTQVVVTSAFAIPGRARRTPFVAFCGGRVLRGWHGEEVQH